MAGEPTQTSVVLVARLHNSDTLVNNNLRGIDGFIKFRITRDTRTKFFMESSYFRVKQSNDFTAKFEFTGLRPGQKYFYSISYGRDTSNNTSSSWSNFNTLNLPVSDRDISFVVTNSLNYRALLANRPSILVPVAVGPAFFVQFPVFNALSSCNPDFWIGNGEMELSGNSKESVENSQQEIRIKWHNLFSIPEFNKMISHIPSYWLLTDHVIAQKALIEQLPIISDNSKHKINQRTYRLNRDVQIWMPGSLFNNADGAGNSILQKEQFNWLKTSLKESDSPFKLIISTTAVIGQDNLPGNPFQAGNQLDLSIKDSLFNWLKNNGFRNNGLYFICNSPDRQYHSIDPSGFEEFSCGSLIGAEAPLEMSRNDSITSDPEIKIIQLYSQLNHSGGFLLISSNRDEYNSPVLLFRFFDEDRKLLYAVNKY